MLKKAIPLLILLLSFAIPALAIQFESQIVEKIEVILMNQAPEADSDTQSILARIKTKQGDFFSQVDFDNDLKILAQSYDRIDPKVESIDGKIFIRLRLWPKPIIRTLTWSGNNNIETKQLQKELGIAPCAVYDKLEFNKAFHKIKAYYIKKGYFEAEMLYEVRPDSLTNEVDVEVIITEGRCGRIKDIVFHNLSRDEECDILDFMATKTWNIFTSWYTKEGTYNEEAILRDEFMILNYLQNEGYADAKVNLEIREANCKDRIIVHITVDKGQQYCIGKISFSGNCIFNNECIDELFTIEEGDPYSPDELRNTIISITNYYGNKGYIDALVDYEPRLDVDQCTYSIHFNIEEGDQFRVGLIKLFGNYRTEARVILHETLVAPGEIFNLEKLQKTEDRLRNIGYFCNVNVYAVKSEGECENGNYRDVHIEVEETSTGNFGAFGGYSTVESVFGGFNITEKNFDYLGVPFLWVDGLRAIKGAGQYAHFTTTIGAKSRSFVFSWTKPYFMDTPWSVGFDVERSSNRYISNDYDIEAWGLALHAKYPVNQYVRFGWHYRLRNTHVNVEKDKKNPQLERAAHNAGLISASGVSWIYDSRDQIGRPTNGFYSRFQTEFAGLGGEHTFMSFAYLNAFYFPIGCKAVIKYRADLKFLQPLGNTTADTVPLDERFFLGGDDGVRGYRPFAIGPKFEPGGDPKGGMTLAQLSGEYSYLLTNRVDLFLFADAGSLTFDPWEIGDFKVAVGYGVRLKILDAGPAITIGMGYPLNAHSHSDVKRFFFQMGARF